MLDIIAMAQDRFGTKYVPPLHEQYLLFAFVIYFSAILPILLLISLYKFVKSDEIRLPKVIKFLFGSFIIYLITWLGLNSAQFNVRLDFYIGIVTLVIVAFNMFFGKKK